MTERLHEAWSYVSTTPLLWLALTVVVFHYAEVLYRRLGMKNWANPVLVCIAVLGTVLVVTRVDYQRYLEGAGYLHFLLGPATVALAVPLHRELGRLRGAALALVVSLVVGSLTAIATAWAIAKAFGVSPELIKTLLPKSATTPIAMGISEQVGGIPSLTAAIVVLTGVVGAAFGGWVLDRCRVTDPVARGLAWGVAAHGLGTATAMRDSATAGAFAGLAMGLNGGATAVLVPVFLALFG